MGQQPDDSIRILLVEDLEADAERAMYQLKRAGLACAWRRVETEPALQRELREFSPSLILSDFSLPQFDGMSALRIAREVAPQVPFVFLSGTIGEERAIEALHAGAVDYVLKENLARLAPAVKRAIGEAQAGQERARQDAQIARLNRVLRMQSGVNGLVLRVRDRNDLLRETCRLAVTEGGYAAAIAFAEVTGAGPIQPVAWSSVENEATESLATQLAASAGLDASLVGTVVGTAAAFVCNNTADAATEALTAPLRHAGMLSVVALPLLVDGTTIAVLVLASHDANVVSADELAMLHEAVGNLSFGLQYLQRDTRARFLSHFDPQTGLAKRPLFCERVRRLIGLPVGERVRHAVIVADIERLSLINDSFGRRTGDLLLQHMADRLKQHYPTGQIAHFGGGTFAIVRTQGERQDEQIRANVRRQLEKICGRPFTIEGHTIPVVARIGMSLWPDDGEQAMALVENAEAALQHARSSSEQVVRYSAASRSNRVGRLALEHRLRFALERNEFELHYQPKVNIISRRIQGAEALLRWRSPEEGLIAPGTFLPTLEATGLIVDVGDWVVQQATRDCREWMQAGLPPVRIAVNIAPLQLRQPEFEEKFLAAIAGWSSPEWGLDVEITEGALHDDSPAEVEKLRRLREQGVQVAIDDFGTGYSSLSRLATLPVDTLKIDRSFIASSLDQATGASLVRTIIALASAMEMTTVAEGVEREQELDLLRELGCEQSQGYLHSRPVPAAGFTSLLCEGKDAFTRPAAHAGRRASRGD